MEKRAECFQTNEYAKTYPSFMSKVIGDKLDFSVGVSIILPIILIVGILVVFGWLMVKSNRTISSMVNPNIQATYSILNYYQVRLIQYQIGIIYLVSLLQITFFAMGSDFSYVDSCLGLGWPQKAMDILNQWNMVITQLILLMQNFEWIAVCFIIVTQKDRSIEQIYYEHQVEGDSDQDINQLPTQVKEHRYKHKERLLRCIFKLYLSCFVLYGFVMSFAFIFHKTFESHSFLLLINIYLCGIQSLMLIMSMVYLLYLMRKLHYYEFKRNWKAVVLFAASTLFGFIIQSATLFFGTICDGSNEFVAVKETCD